MRKLAPLLLPGKLKHKAHPVRRHCSYGQSVTLAPVVMCTQAQEGCSYCLQMHTHSQVYPVQKQLAASTDPTIQAPPVEPFHSMSVHLPFRSVSNTLSGCHLQSLVTNVLQHINILSQHLEYPHSTALSSWGRKWLKAVAMQPKGLQFRRVLSYCTIVLYFCFQSWFRVLVRV